MYETTAEPGLFETGLILGSVSALLLKTGKQS